MAKIITKSITRYFRDDFYATKSFKKGHTKQVDGLFVLQTQGNMIQYFFSAFMPKRQERQVTWGISRETVSQRVYIKIILDIRGLHLDTYILYGIATLLLALSFFKDKKKTKKSLKKAWKSFENILPQFLVVLLLVGVLLAVLNTDVISKIIGSGSGWLGVVLAATVGAITLIPGFVAFPMASMLLQGGAGYMQIGAFVSTLMMVGVVTLPVEIKYFGKRVAILRNCIAFIFSFVIAYIIGLVVGGI